MGAAIPAVGMRKTGKPGHKKETQNVRWKDTRKRKIEYCKLSFRPDPDPFLREKQAVPQENGKRWNMKEGGHGLGWKERHKYSRGIRTRLELLISAEVWTRAEKPSTPQRCDHTAEVRSGPTEKVFLLLLQPQAASSVSLAGACGGAEATHVVNRSAGRPWGPTQPSTDNAHGEGCSI